MKLRRFLFAFLISLAAFQFCFSQEKPKAELIDEFGEVGCDELTAHLDVLFIDLMNDPNSKGYIIIYGDTKQPLRKYTYEKIIEEYIKLRKFDRSRIEFIHGKDKQTLRTELLKVSVDADELPFDEESWNYVLPQTFKSTMFHADSWISEVCPEVFGVELYSNFISANPNLRGHLVIYDKSVKEFRKTEIDLLNQLVKKYKVSRNQLKFFFVKRKESDIEYWLVPKKKK